MKFIVALLVLVTVVTVNGGRRAGGGGGRQRGAGKGSRVRGLPADAQNVATWTQTLVDQGVPQMAYSMADGPDQVWLIAPNKRTMKQQGYSASKTLFDFSGGSLVAVMKLKKWCFRLPSWPSATSKQSVLDLMASDNGTTKAAAAPTEYYATDLADQSSVQGRAAVSTLCGSKPVQDLSTSAPVDLSNAKTFLVVTRSKAPVNDQLSIVVAKKARGGAGGGRRGGGGAGRRGGNGGAGRRGNRNNN